MTLRVYILQKYATGYIADSRLQDRISARFFIVRAGNADAVALRKGPIVNVPLHSRENTFWRLTIVFHGRVLA